jgi:hypothetical protein
MDSTLIVRLNPSLSYLACWRAGLGSGDVGEGSETAWVAAANYASFRCSRVLKQAVVGTRVKITCWKPGIGR